MSSIGKQKYCMHTVCWARMYNGTKGWNKNPIYVFPEKELRGLSPNFHSHVSVSDLYIPTVGVPILLQENM
jgi:hypothetical protein